MRISDWSSDVCSSDLGSGLIAARLGKRILARGGDAELSARVARLVDEGATLSGLASLAERPPHFCSGCPHNNSTNVPAGSRAFTGIGCHGLVLPMQGRTSSYTHMGGAGANWIRLSRYSPSDTVLQILVD